MEKFELSTDILRNAKLSSESLNVDSTLSALNILANGLKDITIKTGERDTLEYMSDILTQVVECFGGQVYGTGKTSLIVDVTQDDIDNGRNYVTLLTEPLMVNDSISSVTTTIKQL